MRRALAAAMAFLGNTDALIIDIRRNTGGHRDMVNLVASYFFDEEPRPIYAVFWRFADTTEASFSMLMP